MSAGPWRAAELMQQRYYVGTANANMIVRPSSDVPRTKRQ